MFGFFISSPDTKGAVMIKILASIAGVMVSVIWFFVSKSSIDWIDTWRKKFVEINNDINPYKTFVDGENVSSGIQKWYQLFRPEIISTFMPVGFALGWMWLAVDKFGA